MTPQPHIEDSTVDGIVQVMLPELKEAIREVLMTNGVRAFDVQAEGSHLGCFITAPLIGLILRGTVLGIGNSNAAMQQMFEAARAQQAEQRGPRVRLT